MGIFDKLFNRKKENKVKTNESRNINRNNVGPVQFKSNYYTEIGGSDESVTIYDIKKISEDKHHNVYVARAQVFKSGNAIMLEAGDYISFEITPELEAFVLQNGQYRDNFEGYLSLNYLSEKSKNKEMENYYFGEMVAEVDENNYVSYTQGNKSKDVEDKVNEYVSNERKKLNDKYMESYNRRKEEEYIESLNVRDKIEKQNIEERKQRLEKANNPYLKEVNKYDKNGKVCYDYDGINTSKEEYSGYILRIRELEKVGKDGAGTYLYKGLINNTPNESDVELLNHRASTPVCFELYRRLEDIVSDNNPQEINSVLDFLSNPRNFANKDRLNYIGHLDQKLERMPDGKLEWKPIEIREPESNSPAIASQIKSMQREFDTHTQQL